MARKPTDQVQLKLRFDERLRRRLEHEAQRNNRSLNSEIVRRLEQSYELPERLRKKLEAAALHNRQSMNSEIYARLWYSFQREEDKEKDKDKDMLIAKAIIESYPDIADRIGEDYWEARHSDMDADRYDDTEDRS